MKTKIVYSICCIAIFAALMTSCEKKQHAPRDCKKQPPKEKPAPIPVTDSGTATATAGT